MRKFLQVVGIAALAILVAAPAMAIEFQFKGSYRMRMYAADGYGAEGATTAASPFVKGAQSVRNQADVRFRPWFIARDDKGAIESGIRFEIGDVNFGSAGGGGTGTDGVNVETKWAYLDFKVPGGFMDARLRAGLQGFFLPKGMLLDDDAGGLTLKGKAGMVTYEAFWFVTNDIVNGGTQVVLPGGAIMGPHNDDIDVYGAKLDFNISRAIMPYIYTAYRHGTVAESVIGTNPSSASSDGWWFGLGATGKLGIVNYDADFVYGYDEPALTAGVGAARERVGWMIDGGVDFPIGPVVIGIRGTYATGDDANTVDKNEDFPGMGGTAAGSSLASYTPKGAQIFWNSNGSAYWRGGYAATGANLWGLGAYLEYRPVKALMTRLTGYFVGAAQSNTNFWTGKSQIGYEVNLLGEYQLYTGFKVWGLAGMLLTPSQGQTAAGKVDLKNVSVVSIGVQHDF